MATPVSDAKALDIRERYEWLHELNNDAPEHDRIRPGEIDAKIAAEHNISVTTVRDVVMGLALLTAPPGRPRRLATAARVVADLGDAAAFGAGLAGRTARAPVVALAAASWGAVALLADVLDERAGR